MIGPSLCRVINVSSPNTPGLRDLQAADRLRPLLAAGRSALDEASPRRWVPLLVKIAPDLADPDAGRLPFEGLVG